MNAARSKSPEEHNGRIESHGKGVGMPTPDAVERRAREIARIRGRSGDEFTADDLSLATRELHDKTLELSVDDERSDLVATSNPADMAADTGHHVANMRPADEQQVPEAEIKEGVREAEHERMLEGQRIEKGTGGSGQP